MSTFVAPRCASVSLVLFALLAGRLFGDDPPPVKENPPENKPAKEAQYTVRAYLRVSAAPPSITAGGEAKIDRTEFDLYKRSLALSVKTPIVFIKALDNKPVAKLPIVKQHPEDLVDWLTGRIEVKFPGNAEVMTIGMTGDDREQLKTLVDGVVETFMSEIVDKQRTDRIAARLLLDKKIRDLKQTELEKRRQLFELGRQIGSSYAESGKLRDQVAVDELKWLIKLRRRTQQDIADVGMKIDLAKATKKDAEKVDDAATKALEVKRQLLTERAEQLVKEIDVANEHIQKLERFEGDIEQLRAEIAQTRRLIDELAAKATRQNIDIDAPSRVQVISLAGEQSAKDKAVAR